MFVLIPLIFIFVSLAGVFYVVWKKMPYLKKLTIDGTNQEHDFWSEFFPGVSSWIKSIDLEAHKITWMKEFEKFVRRLHIISLRLDNFTNSLLHKIRTKNGEVKNGTNKVQFEKTEEPGKIKAIINLLEVLKKEEQRLIIEIAKDPKNPDLYRKLGDLYLELKNFKDAEESFSVALDLDPDDSESKNKLHKIKRSRLGV